MNPITMSAPDISDADIECVLSVLKSGHLALGPQSIEFENQMANYIGVPHACTVSSGTAGLFLALKALSIGVGDEVIVPSFTFVASVNAIMHTGATPVFVDIEPRTWNLDCELIPALITKNTKAIMGVDVFGHPVRWDTLKGIAKKHNLSLIDDSCEALGSSYQGKKIGAWADVSVFAFYPNKQMTTGEGGMVVTPHAHIDETIRSLRNQGRNAMSAWLEHQHLGYNFRMSELSAALGVSQLERINSIVRKRKLVADTYEHYLSSHTNITRQVIQSDVDVSWFTYTILLPKTVDRNQIMKDLTNRGIPTRNYFPPVHTQPYIKKFFSDEIKLNLPMTESISKRTLTLPFHNHITEDQISFIANTLREELDLSDTNRPNEIQP